MTKKILTKDQEKWLNQIYNLIQEINVSESERKILIQSKNAIEKGGMFESHMIDLRNALLPLVVSGKISKTTLTFYKELRADREISLGVGDSLLIGMMKKKVD